MNTIPGNKAERRAFHEARSSGLRDDDKNPRDCGCGRSWYKRYHKICPGCHKEISACSCMLAEALARTGGENVTVCTPVDNAGGAMG